MIVKLIEKTRLKISLFFLILIFVVFIGLALIALFKKPGEYYMIPKTSLLWGFGFLSIFGSAAFFFCPPKKRVDYIGIYVMIMFVIISNFLKVLHR